MESGVPGQLCGECSEAVLAALSLHTAALPVEETEDGADSVVKLGENSD